MSKRDVVADVKPWRGVDWNEKAVAKRLAQGPLWMGPKADGVRLHIWATPRGLIVLSRAGKPFPALGDAAVTYIETSLVNYGQLLDSERALDCELWIHGLPMEEANGRLSTHRPIEGDELATLRIMVFDAPTIAQLTEQDDIQSNLSMTLHQRRAEAVKCIKAPPHSSDFQIELEQLFEVKSLDDIDKEYQRWRRLNWEGGMVKDAELPYRNGKVSGIWKRKPKISLDGTITGFVWGDPDKANAGKVVGFRVLLENGVEVACTGFTQEFMEEQTLYFEVNCIDWQDSAQDSGHPSYGRIAEVTAMEQTKAGSLRHPSFKRFRDLDTDKGTKV